VSANAWRGVESIKAEKAFDRRCKLHRQPLYPGKGDTMRCPAGHDVDVSDPENFMVVEVGRRPNAAPVTEVRMPQPQAVPTPASRAEKPGTILDSQNFHSLGGQRMQITLVTGKATPFMVRVKRISDAGKADSGILETAATEAAARSKFAERIQQAEDRGWRVGRLRKIKGLTDIPAPDEKTADPMKRKGRAK